jgi:diaminohydroxyphosphoribosylaminopyrimidine deaminase/5-amino-6-(5-phosphoribosylamino)uracil reductase
VGERPYGELVETELAFDDESFMRRALELARRGRGKSSPNPMVGAVVVSPDGRIVGEGWHEWPGTRHAEPMALAAAGSEARGATLYVTLEPCNHTGRTPPCAPAVIAAGIRRVVAATGDPNPNVNGQGFALLRDAGLRVEVGPMAAQAERLTAGFLKHTRTGLPFVTLKMAASLDGRVAARDGSSRWITGSAARDDVHSTRAESDAIMVGAGTVAADDPSLTIRLDGYDGRAPLRVVVDGRGRTPPAAAVCDRAAPTLVATTPMAPAARLDEWRSAGSEVVVFDPVKGSGPEVPLRALMAELGRRDVQTVLLEGGPTLAWSAVRDGVVDRFVLYLAPKLVGGTNAPGVLGGEGIPGMDRALGVRIEDVERIGDDLKVVAVPAPPEGA